MSKIKCIEIKKEKIKISLESNIEHEEYIKINIKYIDNIKKLIGLEIFDQETIDKKIEQIITNKKLKMELSNTILKIASKELNIEPFEYINNNKTIPKLTNKNQNTINIENKTITNILKIIKENNTLTGDNPMIFDIATAMNIKYIKTNINKKRLKEIEKLIKNWYYNTGDKMEIVNIKDHQEYMHEVALLTAQEWSIYKTQEELENKIKQKIKKMKDNLDNPYYCKLLLIDNNNLIGFISLFETDGEYRQDLKPWYATMYVKKEYRKKGYSKLLNDAIIKEARKRNFKKIYLKSELKNYYEKFGAIYIEDLPNKEKLYYIKIKED